jgi:predicted DsbA family dithiol-disulfide isomerase
LTSQSKLIVMKEVYKMKIQIWSDFVCPFCYLGKRHLERALEQLPNQEKVEIEYRSFELDPNQPLYSGINMYQLLSKKYNMSIEDAIKANERIGRQAAKVGLDYNFDEMKPTNTFDAHRLMKYAKTMGKEEQIVEKIFSSYFTEAKLISDHDTLVEIAVSVGLDRDTVIAVLKDNSMYENDVRRDESMARQYGITGVPYMLINQKYAISGAQPIEAFMEALQKVGQEEELTSKENE